MTAPCPHLLPPPCSYLIVILDKRGDPGPHALRRLLPQTGSVSAHWLQPLRLASDLSRAIIGRRQATGHIFIEIAFSDLLFFGACYVTDVTLYAVLIQYRSTEPHVPGVSRLLSLLIISTSFTLILDGWKPSPRTEPARIGAANSASRPQSSQSDYRCLSRAPTMSKFSADIWCSRWP